jgi:shikimate dehydrogenase
MNIFGLIGHPLTHSFSKQYFNNKFKEEGLVDVFFELFDIEKIEQIQNIIANESVKGLAVTIPYKQQIIPYLDSFDAVVKTINACNCIKIIDGKLIGYNTDVIGFEQSLLNNLKSFHNKALVLGNGGAAAAIKYVLHKLNIDYKTVSRQKNNADFIYEDLNASIIKSHSLIINTTPLGTYPDINNYPNIPYQYLTKNHYLFDLVYNPSHTTFMKKGLQHNAFVKNGYEMLVIQAECNWKIWNSISENIVLMNGEK